MPVPSAKPPTLPPADLPLGADGIDQYSTADYIFDMSKQLATMASAAGLDLLAYLLDMVRLEAEGARNRAASAEDHPTQPR